VQIVYENVNSVDSIWECR